MTSLQKAIFTFLFVIIGGGLVILSYIGIPSPQTEIRKVIPTPQPVN